MEKNQRLGYLDSIRGLAALTVMLHHVWFAHLGMEESGSIDFPALLATLSQGFFYFLWLFASLGRAAVLVFFVLSGFVLAYSLTQRPATYAEYIIRRFFRIYPAFLVAVLISYVLYNCLGIQHDFASGWLRDVVHGSHTFTALFKHLLLWGTKEGIGLDDVIWSLVHEMRISIIFPFILFSIIRYRWRAVLAYWLLSIACTLCIFFTTGLPQQQGVYESSYLRSFLNTGYFVIFFAAGCYLAVTRETMTANLSRLPKWQHILLLALSIYCLTNINYSPKPYMPSAFDYMRGVGTLVLIALTLANNAIAGFLNQKIPVWLGRISYSLYLVHVPVIYVVSQTVGAVFPLLITCVFIIAVSLAAAEIMAAIIEYPCIRIGRAICERFRPC